MAEFKRLIARRIRKARQIAGMTRKQCDASFGQRGRYHNMEDGKTSLSQQTRLALADLFDVHPTLFGVKKQYLRKKDGAGA